MIEFSASRVLPTVAKVPDPVDRDVARSSDFVSSADVPLSTEVTFPIDVVYTWLDGQDLVWASRRDMASIWEPSRVCRSIESMNSGR